LEGFSAYAIPTAFELNEISISSENRFINCKKTISFTSNPYFLASNNANKKISASSSFTFKAFKSSAFCFLPSQFFRQFEL
jgi:hypothetical protein